jgi:hypothetical protein
MASSTLNIGNAIGLAVLVAISNAGLPTGKGIAAREAIARGGWLAVLLTATGMLLGLLITLALRAESLALPPPRRTRNAATS